MKHVHRPVNVMTDAKGNPSGLKGPRRDIRVRQILDFGRSNARWWHGDAPRDYYLIELESGHVVEVYRSADQWILSRIAD